MIAVIDFFLRVERDLMERLCRFLVPVDHCHGVGALRLIGEFDRAVTGELVHGSGALLVQAKQGIGDICVLWNQALKGRFEILRQQLCIAG